MYFEANNISLYQSYIFQIEFTDWHSYKIHDPLVTPAAPLIPPPYLCMVDVSVPPCMGNIHHMLMLLKSNYYNRVGHVHSLLMITFLRACKLS